MAEETIGTGTDRSNVECELKTKPFGSQDETDPLGPDKGNVVFEGKSEEVKQEPPNEHFESENNAFIELHRFETEPCDGTVNYFSSFEERKSSQFLDKTKHPCDQCDYVATKRGNLKRHVATKHSEVRFSCEQCTYTTPRRDLLKQHQQQGIIPEVVLPVVTAQKQGARAGPSHGHRPANRLIIRQFPSLGCRHA